MGDSITRLYFSIQDVLKLSKFIKIKIGETYCVNQVEEHFWQVVLGSSGPLISGSTF